MYRVVCMVEYLLWLIWLNIMHLYYYKVSGQVVIGSYNSMSTSINKTQALKCFITLPKFDCYSQRFQSGKAAHRRFSMINLVPCMLKAHKILDFTPK